MKDSNILQSEVPEQFGGLRLDQVLARLFPDFSRSKLQSWIKDGRVHVNGNRLKPKDRLEGGESVVVDAKPEEITDCQPQAIALEIAYQDASIIVINKAAGLVVHPAAGNRDGTMQNALLHYFPELSLVPRAGIVHRLDKGTSGLLVVARTLTAHKHLVDQLQSRQMSREYLAICQGRMTAGGQIDTPIGRHPVDRKRYAVNENGKPAHTHYRIEKRYSFHTLLKVKLDTGRTHQIRVHMAHIRYPLLGDPVYGGRIRIPAASPESLREAIRSFRRQALHAAKLGLVHPENKKYYQWEVPPPIDFTELLSQLESAQSIYIGKKN